MSPRIQFPVNRRRIVGLLAGACIWGPGELHASATGGLHITIRGERRWSDGIVIGVRRYAHTPGGQVAPADLALASAPLTVDDLDALAFHQHQRQLYWRVRNGHTPPLARADIVAALTNIHVVLPTPAIAARLMHLQYGQRVDLYGDLVDVTDPASGWSLRTSTTAGDEGPGACEVLRPRRLAVT